jgi:hypothetical protein
MISFKFLILKREVSHHVSEHSDWSGSFENGLRIKDSLRFLRNRCVFLEEDQSRWRGWFGDQQSLAHQLVGSECLWQSV